MKKLPSKSICVGVIVFVIFLFGAHRHAAGQDAEIEKLLAKRQELVALFEAAKFDELDQRLNSIQAQYEAGELSERELGDSFDWISSWALRDVEKFDKLLAAWVEHNPQSYGAHVVRGTFYANRGFKARGTAYAADTSAAQFATMRKWLRRARKDFETSIPLSHKPLLSHIGLQTVALMDSGREERKALLDQAMTYAPRSYSVRANYMWSLTPRWGGSYEQMEQFARDSEAVLGAGDDVNGLRNVITEDRVNLMLNEKDYTSARALLTKALARHETAKLLCMRAHANVALEKFEEMVSDLQASLKYTRQSEYCADIVYWIAGFAGNEPRIAAILDSYVDRNPSSSNLYLSRAGWRQSRGELRAAFDDFEVAAKMGDPTAQYYAGHLLLTGEGGVEKNPERALVFLRKAARTGGQQVQKDLKDAIAILGLQDEEAARLEARKASLVRMRPPKSTPDMNLNKQHWGVGRLTDHRVIATILGAMVMMAWVRLDRRRI